MFRFKHFFKSPLFWMPVLVMGYVLGSGVTGSCPTCVAITDSLGIPSLAAETSSEASTSTEPSASVTKIPAWELHNLDGETVSNEDFAGEVMLVDFWATWCPPCRAMIPNLIELQEDYADKGFTVVGISLDQEGSEKVAAFKEEYGVNYPMLMGDSAVTEAFGGIQFLPTSFLIDGQGRILARHVGLVEKATLETEINRALAAR